MKKAAKELCQEILMYLAKHPNGEDTLEGIVQGRLLEQRVEAEPAKVKRALDGLLAWGLLTSRRGTDGRRYYRRGQSQNVPVIKRSWRWSRAGL